ncbi:SpvB/TcaC N-terminal domain-containing protein [Enhygromyxa salina]|uniref:Mono(ADP-ribosyl)transferase SpvB n=1 Tax=Enhygromyxa salina TaxID=215803 RepID=A0A2S9YW75_9BACT|nr:SpvB/TcaC N-terminal domain-containing protein [Enhygromyxa salina]PRQ09355.1 Mono(ADP-ribosyl)transferase SpvB [Enhygromyxa salina]
MNDERDNGPKLTSGPSLPIQGPRPKQPFNAGVTPGRDAPGAGKQDDPNPFAQVFRSPFGGDQASDPRSTFAPAISLPTGGGAVRSIGEKFSSNPFTGTGSTSVPVATSPGRGGFGPSLALSYGSGQGNGPLGLGWSLGVPTISRKTEKGLPEYWDSNPDPKQNDTFILAGAEDLVEVGFEQRDGHLISQFQPRVEGGFARIERWQSKATRQVFWKTISRDNVTSYFGKTAAARVVDPAVPNRLFSWLLEESHDDRGNIIVYEYKQEDLAGVDTRAPEEQPRLVGDGVQAQRYLKRIKYGNAAPFVAGGWMFEVVLDYGEHGTWHGEKLEISPVEDRAWPARMDTFSSYRAGFEIRTRRLCRRVLMFHHFAELGEAPYLVASTDLVHAEDPAMTRVTGVVQRSYRLDEGTGWFDAAALPTLEFEYSDASVDPVLHEITDAATLKNLPAGIDGRMTRLVDLDGEGVPGLVTEAAGTWYFKRGLGDGRFGPMVAMPSRPTTLGAPGVQLMDLDGDGRKELVSFVVPAPGFFTRTEDEGWGNFRKFSTVPNIDWQDPRVQLIDLAGDGFPDVLVDRGDNFGWYRSKGVDGFEAPKQIPNTHDAASRPMLVFNDARISIQFADMTGDGLPDLVRVRNGEVAYWPCLGFGQFGRMIRMGGLSSFASASDLFHPSRVRLSDVDGSGTTDLIYLGDRGATIYRNLSGNGFAAGEHLSQFPSVRSVDWAEVVDLKGNGTGCLVWSTSHSAGRGGVLRYIDLTSGTKPHLLVATKNNMGAETRVRYAPSTKFYLADKAAGKPWATKLPFPVHVVDRVEQIDHVTRQRYVQHFAYHHGYFDGGEREFRGFGMVETWDTESFENFSGDGLFAFAQFDAVEEHLHQPPVYTKSGFHTGAYLAGSKFSRLFAGEYWSGDPVAWTLPDSRLPSWLSGDDRAEAVRALAGRTLRTEVYALDGSELEGVPYTVSEATFEVRQLRGRGDNRHGIYLAHDRESLSYQYERDVADPRIGHSFVLEVDDYGTVLRSAAVAYPRRETVEPAEQAALHVTLSEAEVAHVDGDPNQLRLAVPVESRSYEVHGLVAAPTGFTWQAVRDAADSATPVTYDGELSDGIDKRLLSRSRVRYFADDLSGPLPHGSVESKALAYDSDAMAMTQTQRQSVFGELTGAPTDAELEDVGKYVLADDAWWVRTGHPTYDASKFYAVTGVTDPYGNIYSTTYDAHALLTVSSTDPLGNTVTAEHDFRVLGPWQLTDANGNRSQVAFDVLGLVTASAVMGKVGDSDGDTLDDPTSTFEYDLFAWQDSGKPNWAKTRVRETHQDPDTRWLEQRAYFSGGGGVVMVKAQARPGLAPQRDVDGQLVLVDGEIQYEDTSPDVRWVGNGRVVFDNKGNVLKAYEPYFSSTPEYEDEAELVEQGVTSLNHYDPLGRMIRTDLPNGTFSRVEFTPWQQTSWDVNDTVLDSHWYAERISYQGPDVALEKEHRAAQLAAKHANTPSKVHLDTLGRPFLSVAHNKDLVGNDEFFETKSVLDIQGNVLEVVDARGNSAETRTYGMLGQSLFVGSVDAGDRRHLLTALGQPMHSWDARDQRFYFSYDTLRRPVDRTVSVGGGAEKLLGRVVYGDLLASPEAANHRGRVYRVYDGAGVATSLAYDFKGQPTHEQRQLVASKTTQPDWSALLGQSTIPAMATAAAPLLDPEMFSASSERDALGRVLKAISPDNSEVTYTYDDGGGLRRVELKHRGSATVETVVGDITYNARGQRERVIYGLAHSPTTTTSYTYDPKTYRLARLSTLRGSDNASLQGLHYHYEPAGNVTDIRDTAQQTVYFNNAVVEAANSYTYDATYRLIEATGREHATQGTTQRTHEQLPVGPQPMTSDPSAMRRYTQRYAYDSVGNILKMQHVPAAGTGWTRRYEYAHDGNRLLATSAPGDAANGPYTHTYSYDVHGSMTTMPHLAAVDWNHDDELQHATTGTEQVYFQYAGGIRSRKFTAKQGSTTEERIYLGPFEIYRKRVNGTLDLERESLHISDGSGRICMVETKRIDGGSSVRNLTCIWRYQLSNHLGSAATEVDGSGAVISYEEYHPYGTSAYRAVNASIDVSAKRYSYTGMERDEETGLEYCSARYFGNWLGRWIGPDPAGLEAGVNRFQGADANPATKADRNGKTAFAARVGQMATQAVDEARNTTPAPEDYDALKQELVDLEIAQLESPESDDSYAAQEALENEIAIIRESLADEKEAWSERGHPFGPTLAPQGGRVNAQEYIGPGYSLSQDELRVRNFARGGTAGTGPTFKQLTGIAGASAERPIQEFSENLVPVVGHVMRGLELVAVVDGADPLAAMEISTLGSRGATPRGPTVEGTGASQFVSNGDDVTDELVRQAMKNAPLKSNQEAVSLPVIRAYVDRLAAGDVAPAISVSGGVITEGHHRYIAGRLFGSEPAQRAGTRVANQATKPAVAWENVILDMADWGNR